MYDMYSKQVLTALHRYRDVKFSPPILYDYTLLFYIRLLKVINIKYL